MSLQTVHLDLAKLTTDQQVARLKEQHVFLRGKRALVRARVHELPARQYISLLERGYRVGFEREDGGFLDPRSQWIDASHRTSRRALSGEP
jgi:hypothetical protein